MPTRFYCPNCWNEVAEGTRICPYCGFDLSSYDILSYEEKLLLSLKHPIRENRMIAIQLLGKLKSRAALPVFESILDSERDFYVIREIIFALIKIDDEKSRALLSKLKRHKSTLIRKVLKSLM